MKEQLEKSKQNIFEKLDNKFKNREITDQEQPFVQKILSELHLSNGVILSYQNDLGLLFMSLPLASFLTSMEHENIDKEFMVYISLLKDLNIEDKRLITY